MSRGNVRGDAATRRFRQRHRRARQDALARLRQRPMAHAFALLLLALALLALLLLKAGIDQFRHVGAPLQQAHSLSLFLAEDADADVADALAIELRADRRVADVQRISPDEGLAELVHLDGSEQALAALNSNPLPWVLAVEPHDRDAAIALAAHWRDHAQVADVAEETQWRDRADAVVRTGRALLLTLIVLVAAGVLLLVANAVRTIRVEGNDERALQRVFGASEADLRRPYLYLGAFYGLIASGLALILAMVVFILVDPVFDDLAQAFALEHVAAAPAWPWLLGLIPAAMALGTLGAWLACLFERDTESAA